MNLVNPGRKDFLFLGLGITVRSAAAVSLLSVSKDSRIFELIFNN